MAGLIDVVDIEYCFVHNTYVNIVFNCSPEILHIQADSEKCMYIDRYLRIDPFLNDVRVIVDITDKNENGELQSNVHEIALSEKEREDFRALGESCVQDEEGWSEIFSSEETDVLRGFSDRDRTLADLCRTMYWKGRMESNGNV